jgi:hypothetical protein
MITVFSLHLSITDYQEKFLLKKYKNTIASFFERCYINTRCYDVTKQRTKK